MSIVQSDSGRLPKRAVRWRIVLTGLVLPITAIAALAAPSGAAARRDQVATAQARAARAQKPAKSLNLPSLKSKPSGGHTVVYLNYPATGNDQTAAGMQAAVKKIGWTYKQIIVDPTNPASVVSGFKQALQYKPSVVAESGVPPSLIASVFPAYEQAGVPIALVATIADHSTPKFVVTIPGAPYSLTSGAMLANKVIADSKGKAKILFVGVDSYPILAAVRKSFDATVHKGCSGCRIVDTVQLTTSQLLGQTGAATVTAALQRNPSVNYVVEADAVFLTNLPPLLKSNGLAGRVKVAGVQSDVNVMRQVQSGQLLAATGVPFNVIGWEIVDAGLRNVEGMKLPQRTYNSVPIQLLVKGGDWTVSNNFEIPANYQSEFLKAWKIKS